MSVKKVVSNEPEWAYVARKQRKTGKPKTDMVTPTTYNAAIPEACFKFTGKYAELFGEKHIVFSKLDNPERIYFKLDDSGYKATRTKTTASVKFKIYDVKQAFDELWVGKSYEIHEERGYYYIERVDEIEALFEEPEEVTEVTMNRLKKGKGLPKETKQPTRKNTEPPANAVYMTPMPESGINDKKVLAVLTRMKEKGFVAMRDLKGMNLNDREYYKAVNDLVMVYGYSIVDIPCIDSTGKRFFVKALYNGTGVWE